MKLPRSLAAVVVGASLVAVASATPVAASGPAMCILSWSSLDVQVAFSGPSRTTACKSALAEAGPYASTAYAAPVGNPACVVLYAPGDPNIVQDGAIVFDSGSGQASQLCSTYAASPGLFVYNLDGTAY